VFRKTKLGSKKKKKTLQYIIEASRLIWVERVMLVTTSEEERK